MQELYRLVLEDAGYTVDVKSVGQREVYAPALESGEIDVVPDYAATMAEYLNREKNGPDAEAIATSDAGETVEAMTPLAEEKGLTVLEPSGALDANGFYVTQEFAEQNDLATLSATSAPSASRSRSRPATSAPSGRSAPSASPRPTASRSPASPVTTSAAPPASRRSSTATPSSASPAPPTARSRASAWSSSRTTRSSRPPTTWCRSSTPSRPATPRSPRR